MPPKETPYRDASLTEMLGGSAALLCSGLSHQNGVMPQAEIIPLEEYDSLFVDKAQMQEKALLGRRLGATLGQRSASALRAIVDEDGRLRCPPGTPNANQFTNFRLVGCMERPGSGRSNLGQTLAEMASDVPEKDRPRYSPRAIAMAKREQHIVSKYGSLSTTKQQKEALGRAFKNANVIFRDPASFFINPLAKRRSAAAQRSFVIALLAEAEDSPETAAAVQEITNLLRGAAGRRSSAMTTLHPESGIGIHMSPLATTWLMSQWYDKQIRNAQKDNRAPFDTTHSAGIDLSTSENEMWHHAGVHEFGHAVDIVNLLKQSGFNLQTDTTASRSDWVRTGPALDPEIETKIQSIYAQVANEPNPKQRAAKFAKLWMGLLFYGRIAADDDSDINAINDLIKSSYAEMARREFGGAIGEHIAELYAHGRLIGFKTADGKEDERSKKWLESQLGKRVSAWNKPEPSRGAQGAPRDGDWQDDDDDWVAGIKKPKVVKKPSWGFSLQADEEEEGTRIDRFERHDPLSLKRRAVPIQGLTLTRFLQLYDEVFDAMQDMMRKMDSSEDVERDRKRIAKLYFNMQLLQKEQLMQQEGEELVLHLTEDNLKRLYKGFESMIRSQDYWADNELATNIFNQLKSLYRQQFDKFPEIKYIGLGLTVKVAGRSIGRRAARAIRNIADRPEYDGDSDGFITNPLTGRDEIPWNKAKETPEDAMKRFFGGKIPPGIGPTLQAMSDNRANRPPTLGAMDDPQSTRPTLRLSSAKPAGFRGARTNLTVMREALDVAGVRRRDWRKLASRYNKIVAEMRTTYPRLTSVDDYAAAFRSINPDIRLVGYSDTLSQSQRGFLFGLLYAMTKFPEHYKELSKAEIVYHPTAALAKEERAVHGTGTTYVWPALENESGAPVLTAAGMIESPRGLFEQRDSIFDEFGNYDIIGRANDSVSNQVLAAYLRSPDYPDLSDDDKFNTAVFLKFMTTGMHEGSHGVHLITSILDIFPNKFKTSKDLQQKLTSVAQREKDALIDSHLAKIGMEWASNFIKLILMTNDKTLERLTAELSTESDPARQAKIQQRIDAVKDAFQKYGPELAKVLQASSPTTKAMRDMLQDIISQGGDSGNSIKDLHEKMMANPQVLREFVTGRSQSPGDLRKAIWNKHGQALVLRRIRTGNLFDDLSAVEIAKLRNGWKYISEYARDRNSYYKGDYFMASLEGIAEAMTFRLWGMDAPKEAHEAQQILNKLLAWMAVPSPRPEIKSVHNWFDGQTKALCNYLSIRSTA